MRKAIKTTLTLAASAAMVAGAFATPSLVSAWGDNTGGRRSYTIDQINHGALGNKITFNSISDSTIGDEKNFVGAREYTGVDSGKYNVWNGNNITVQDGKEYLIRLYVHNNNPWGTDAVAKNTKVAFNIPTDSSTRVQVNGFITSDNATPSKYWDYVNFNSDQLFHLEYVYGSALIENNGIGKNGGRQLSDEIVTKAASNNGTLIGYSQLDGNIPGCYQYASYITIRVKAVFDKPTTNPNAGYTITQKVRASKDGEPWSTKINAKVGDKVDFQLTYLNTSAATQNNVMIRAQLPSNLRYVPGTTKIYNAKYNGSILSDGITTTGVNIGNYTANSNAYIRFTAEVVDDNLADGSNTLVMWGKGGVGQTTLNDYAAVVVQKSAPDPVNPQGKEYSVKVNYLYADGSKAAEPYEGKFQEGDNFRIESPILYGYTASSNIISGVVAKQNLEFNVVYTKDQAPTDPEAEDRTVTIKYVYAKDGSQAAPDYVQTAKPGTQFNVVSPAITGYVADYEVVSGTLGNQDLIYTVTYSAEKFDDPIIRPSTPDPTPSTPEPGTKLPSTGPEAIMGSIMGIGSIATAAGYYISSRRALK